MCVGRNNLLNQTPTQSYQIQVSTGDISKTTCIVLVVHGLIKVFGDGYRVVVVILIHSFTKNCTSHIFFFSHFKAFTFQYVS